MKIYFDSRWFGDHGIGKFAREIEQRLRLPHLRIDGSPSSPFDPLLLLLAMLIKTPKDACVFSPGYNAPLFIVRPYIFTIHDLNHIDRPENSSFLKSLYYRLIIHRACHRSIRVLTVSEFSRQRIIAWAGVVPSHVVNVGNGVDDSYRFDVQPYEPGYVYLLCVSNRKAHKNESRVLEAFVNADIDRDIRLILTGQPSETLLRLCHQFGLINRVVFTGRVPEDDMPSLYRGARALVFPSLYEGFGLPVIESMACGTPVITSNTTSLPEVAGDAALLVNPLSVKEISEAIERICKDKALHNTLQHKGFLQAARFSWDNVTNNIKAVLAELES